jgi:hypothetical protein
MNYPNLTHGTVKTDRGLFDCRDLSQQVRNGAARTGAIVAGWQRRRRILFGLILLGDCPCKMPATS